MLALYVCIAASGHSCLHQHQGDLAHGHLTTLAPNLAFSPTVPCGRTIYFRIPFVWYNHLSIIKAVKCSSLEQLTAATSHGASLWLLALCFEPFLVLS
jgi:hypothetical protein